jgi:hypothetical protein
MSKLSELVDTYEAVNANLPNKPIKSTRLNLPPGKNFWEVPIAFYVNLAKKRSKASVLNSLTNIERAHKNTLQGRRARVLINNLRQSVLWKALGEK